MRNHDDKHTAVLTPDQEASFARLSAMISHDPSPVGLQLENNRLRQALGSVACFLDVMKGLDTGNQHLRDIARGAIREVMGA